MFFVTQSFPALVIRNSFIWPLHPFYTPLSLKGFCFILYSCSPSLFAGITKCSRLILTIFCPSPRTRQLLKEFWGLSLESGGRKQDLASRCAVAPTASLRKSIFTDRARKSMCVLTHVHSCIYKYFYMNHLYLQAIYFFTKARGRNFKS